MRPLMLFSPRNAVISCSAEAIPSAAEISDGSLGSGAEEGRPVLAVKKTFFSRWRWLEKKVLTWTWKRHRELED